MILATLMIACLMAFTAYVVSDRSDVSAVPPSLSDGSVVRTSNTDATIGFSADEAGTAYYLVLASGDAAPDGTAVMDGTSIGAAVAGPNTGKAVVLSAGAKDIYVVVEDAGGSILGPLKIAVPAYTDTIPPVPGNSGIITVSNITHNSLKLNWTAATDNDTTQTELRYYLYISATSNIGTLANCVANGTDISGGSAIVNEVACNVIELSPDTTYYFNIIVEDEAGNKAAYTMKNVTTAPGLGSLTVVLTAWDGKVTLAAQTASTDYSFYYSYGAASAEAPEYNALIGTVAGAKAYAASTDIAGKNGTEIFVQVYKVTMASGEIIAFGEAGATPAVPVLGTLAVSLAASDGKVTLSAQTADSAYAYYYASGAGSVSPPAYGAQISTVPSAVPYSTILDITGTNGTKIFVQVYKVNIASGAIIAFGQSSATPFDGTEETGGGSSNTMVYVAIAVIAVLCAGAAVWFLFLRKPKP
ncbi:MAG: fibronectin type III domain-containing protein [Methanomassiliicoccaceae archaeon]|nr:fibronectin type III domain-containing protein [Methanomassiliicoccaceae archaeon]